MGYAVTTLTLADAVRDTGDLVRADALYREGMRLGVEQQELRNVAVALAGCAAIAAMRGSAEQAARFCGAAAATIERVWLPPHSWWTGELRIGGR